MADGDRGFARLGSSGRAVTRSRAAPCGRTTCAATTASPATPDEPAPARPAGGDEPVGRAHAQRRGDEDPGAGAEAEPPLGRDEEPPDHEDEPPSRPGRRANRTSHRRPRWKAMAPTPPNRASSTTNATTASARRLGVETELGTVARGGPLRGVRRSRLGHEVAGHLGGRGGAVTGIPLGRAGGSTGLTGRDAGTAEALVGDLLLEADDALEQGLGARAGSRGRRRRRGSAGRRPW